MSFQVNVPPSVLAKAAISEQIEDGGDNAEEKTKKREDYKKLKELEEARKAGTAPAMKDEEGKDINPHIPQYIMQAPWYFGASSATLRHQRQQEDKIKTFDEIGSWYKRGVKEGPVSTKYRKGACENCGALTHKKKDCLERPRRLGARYTGSDIAPDEYLQGKINLDYEGKRDRWNGYSIDEHKKIFEEYQKMEEAKKILKAQKLEDSEVGEVEEKPEEVDDEDKDDVDEDKYAEDMDMPGHKFESKQRITVRNLRIREDTAKYLYNLDVNSAYYDPKTRSMRENPFQEKDPTKIPFAGDNFARMTGDAMGIANRQMFAWEAYEKGADVHLQADPTKLEVLNKEYQKRKEEFKTKSKDSVLDKYGGEEHLEAPPKQLLLAQTEDYVEYSRHGTVIKGQEKACVKSRYEEDVFINNHTAVWGSYWKDGKWGFHCCHSTIKESYCTGNAGIEAATTNLPTIEAAPEIVPSKPARLTENEEDLKQASVDEERQALIERIEAQKQKVKEGKKKRKKDKKKKKKKDKKKRKKKKESSSDSSSSSEDEDEKREERIKKAIEEERKRVKRVDQLMSMDERKRPYNSMFDVHEPTEEEVEAFKRTRKNHDDPMANFM